MKNRKRIKHNGSAMMEFALVLPMLLLLVFGIIEFGTALYDKAVITNASREGARKGVIFKTPAVTDEEIKTTIANACAGRLITFGDPVDPEVDIQPPPGTTRTAGTPLSVTVTYNFTGLMLGDLISAMSGTKTLTATTTMVIE